MQVESSRGDKCKDECKPKGGYHNDWSTNKTPFAWCVIEIDWERPAYYDYSRCAPAPPPALKRKGKKKKKKGTSLGLKCLSKCDYHCDCEDGGNSCGDCGAFKSYKWCAVKKGGPFEEEDEGTGWDYC